MKLKLKSEVDLSSILSMILFYYTHIHILNNHLYLFYNSITSIPFNSSSFQNHSISLSFSSILPFLPSFQHNSMNSSPIHPISYSLSIHTLLYSQIFMHVTSLLHYYSIYQEKYNLFLFHYFPTIFSFNKRLFIMYIYFYIDYYYKCNCTILNQNSHPKWTNFDFFQLIDISNMNKISSIFS